MKSKMSTKGLEESLERLARQDRNINQVAAAMLQAGGGVLVTGMQQRAPVGTSPEDPHPGNLKAHIQMTAPEVDGNFVYTEVGLPRKAGLVDADTARYGAAQEYGWADRTGAKAGHPYFRPTLDADLGKARKAMVEVAKEESA